MIVEAMESSDHVIVLSEYSDRLPPSASVRDLKSATEAAKLVGCSVYYIPADFKACENAENALAHVPCQDGETPGYWIGYIPTLSRYRAIYEAALAKQIRLVNAPDEHARAMEFDRAYPRIEGLTPKSFVIADLEQCAAAAEHVGLPVFVKGTVQSRKSRGWKACVAHSAGELEILAGHLLDLDARSRGRVIVRELADLRHVRKSAEEFPLGREYRVFVYRHQVLALGYYWEGEDSLTALSSEEAAQVRRLAEEASRRLDVPYLSVDIGQRVDGAWIVIEVGDGQFAGMSQAPRLQLWNRLQQSLTNGHP